MGADRVGYRKGRTSRMITGHWERVGPALAGVWQTLRNGNAFAT